MNNIRRGILISIAIALVAGIILIFYFSQSKNNTAKMTTSLAVTETTPSNNSIGASVYYPVVFTFNQKVDASSFTASSDPSENWSVKQDTTNSISIEHEQYLRVATKYTLTLLQNGNPVKTLFFETEKAQNDPRQLQILKNELDQNYPLANLTPYETSDYRVVYIAPKTFQISIKSSMTAQAAITEVRAWVESQGIDPNTHKYTVK